VEECAEAFVRGIEQRSRKVYVPASLGAVAAVRQLFANSVADRVLGRQARQIVPLLEREVAALGQSFGAHSVERKGEG
jgi:hypothetical protein